MSARSAPPDRRDGPLARGAAGAGFARGAAGAGLPLRLYRRSPIRWLIKVQWDHRGLRTDDLFLAAYPRSGTSWFRFLFVEMLSGDASFERIRREVPYVGRHHRAPDLLPGGGRIIKTHEPYRRHYRRALHLVRDPRDVAVSYFHFMQRIGKLVVKPGDDLPASLDRFIDAFLDGHVDAHGTWQSHLFSWLRQAEREPARILRVRYEDVRADPAAELTRIGAWLGLELTAKEAAGIAERCSLERMRQAEAEALAHAPHVFDPRAVRTGLTLLRQGSVGGWRTALSEPQQRRFAVFADGLALMGYPLA
jgi:hypothetical protein